MRVLSVTTLYPYPARPRHGVFVENRLRALLGRGHEIRVIAPIPYFPFSNSIFGDYARYANPPASEQRYGIDIRHPRYPIVPKVGMSLARPALTHVFAKAIAEAMADGFRPDVIDAHYLYPDAVAAVAAARHFSLPVVMTARGTDVTLIPEYPRPRHDILWAVERARRVITVADALKEGLVALGADGDKIETVRNGVDLEAFTPPPDQNDRQTPENSPRKRGFKLLSVGHLIERKGHDRVIEAMAGIKDTTLTIVGGGPEETALKRLVAEKGLEARVTFSGEHPHTALPGFYRDADALVLGSTREGWPNVLLEAMACGTPCVATPAHGSVEVVKAPEAGEIAVGFDAANVRDAIMTLMARRPARAATRRYAEGFGWSEVAERVDAIWSSAARSTSAEGFGAPVTLDPLAEVPRLLFTVDTEECFDWRGDFDRWTIPDPAVIDKVQAIAERHGAQPLYFVTYPLLKDPAFAGTLRRLVDEGRAACGLHLHTWSTPPAGDARSTRDSFQCNIDPALHRQKLEALHDAFIDAIGHAPMAHRAGRYGVAPFILDQLADMGVRIDFSPSSGFDFDIFGGPDFVDFGDLPRVRHQRGRQLVVPVSGGRLWRHLPIFVPRALDRPERWIKPLVHRFSAPVRLTPEGRTLNEMKNLTRRLMATRGALLVPSMHLSTLIPGETPYAADAAAVDALLSQLDRFLGWAVASGTTPMSLGALATATGVADAGIADTSVQAAPTPVTPKAAV